MANTRKLRSADFAERIEDEITPLLPPQSSILVGLSGGVDSVVLLHLLCKLSLRASWQLSALHVHHGISPNADQWSDFCAELCTSLQIPLSIEHVDIAPLRSHGIEAAARKLRHAAFAKQQCDFVALAHHADDQAETLLLQLLRGAGLRGVSAMPQLSRSYAGPSMVRPLLHCSRLEIISYAAVHQLKWIEDESNADEFYPRNFLRHRVMPVLEEKFPAYRSTLSRSAAHFAEASMLLDELAEQDAVQAIDEGTLAVSVLRKLSHQRGKNLLRFFLNTKGVQMPQALRLDDMLHQLCDAREDAAVCISCGEHEIRRYLDRVFVQISLGDFDRNTVLEWKGETALDWPALKAQLRFTRTHGQGISLEKLQREPVTFRMRQGGESLRPEVRASTRSLKNLLQEHHIPPWQRPRIPLLYSGDELVWAAGVAIDADYQAHGNESGVLVSCE